MPYRGAFCHPAIRFKRSMTDRSSDADDIRTNETLVIGCLVRLEPVIVTAAMSPGKKSYLPFITIKGALICYSIADDLNP